mmetsp:Transcript_38710/g.74300  ORF Transcript_38710/g.74300 Transcript_38710/m.74300 type:complete len:103 (+) Transcript_38710:2-310(+)
MPWESTGEKQTRTCRPGGSKVMLAGTCSSAGHVLACSVAAEVGLDFGRCLVPLEHFQNVRRVRKTKSQHVTNDCMDAFVQANESLKVNLGAVSERGTPLPQH